MSIPRVHFGEYKEEEPDWRKVFAGQEQPDDDEEPEVCPPDVVGMLGFDPFKEWE